MSLHLWIIPLLPLAGAAINGLLGKRFSKALVNTIALGSTALAFAYAVWVALQFAGLLGRIRFPTSSRTPPGWRPAASPSTGASTSISFRW